MVNSQTTLFLHEEHRIISTYLGVKPVENIPDSITLDVALSTLGLNKEVVPLLFRASFTHGQVSEWFGYKFRHWPYVGYKWVTNIMHFGAMGCKRR